MIGAGVYILTAAMVAAVVLAVGFSAVRIRRRLMPEWEGAPSHLVDAILAIALLIWVSELLGVMQILYAWTLVACSLGVAAGAYATTRAGGDPGRQEAPAAGGVGDGGAEEAPARSAPPSPTTGPAGRGLMSLITIGVVAVVFAHWGLTAKDALDRGIFNFDSLWYHMPYAVEFAKSHSVTGFHPTETVLTNWFYPQNSELLHGVGILLTRRDTLSLFINFGWLAVAFLAAWCVGRPYGRGPLCVASTAVVLECHTLVVREPGAGKNDVAAAALILAAIAILLNASSRSGGGRALPVGWPLAAAGLAVGLAVGTKLTAVAIAAALTVAVIALAPRGRRWAASGWWLGSALAAGGYWYLRNLIATGNPLPQAEHLGPITLPHPERLQSGRPDHSILHYATDTGVWHEYFAPGLHDAFGALWPIVVLGAVAGPVIALAWGRDRALRWIGAVVLFGMLAYLVTPLGAAGAEGEPVGFAINIRFVLPAMLAGAALLPLAPFFERQRSQWIAIAALLGMLLVTDRADAVLRDPARPFGLLVATLAVVIPAALFYLFARRPSPAAVVAASFAGLALLVVAVGYPVQRHYLGDRFGPGSEIPGMGLDPAYVWARDRTDARIGLAGTTAGFLGYGFYGTDLSNEVSYLGVSGPDGAYNAIPSCSEFRAAVNEADLDYLVTAPFLNYIHPDEPIRSPEAGWLRGETAVSPVLRNGEVTVWRVEGRLDPAACGPKNAPLRRIPQQPAS
ncbi:MAG TPA: hypothetical protein VH476_10715 [Solirubrobacterales bacterium]